MLVAGIGFLLLGGVASSDSSITVEQGDFELMCATNTVAEGASLACTLKNTAAEPKPWPVVAILHLSTDSDRALVRGTSIDVTLGAPSPDAAIDGGVTWIGETLVGYSRFDWSGSAGADPTQTTTTVGAPGNSRTVNIVATNDSLDEDSEKFYVALGPDGSSGVGLLYNNKASIALTDDDSPSSDTSLSSLELFAGQSYALSAAHARQSQTVGYEVTEATLTAEAARGTTMTLSASFGGSSVDLDGRGGTSIEVISGEESAAVPLAVGATTVTLTVTAEDGTTTGTRSVRIVRAALGDDVDEVEVSVPGFTLTCPAEVTRGTDADCTLWASRSAEWPVVAVIHSSADGAARALVAEDPIIPDTHPDYHKDVSLGSQRPARTAFNHGYGELFSGGSRTLYRTYGYEKFDWGGTASAGAPRTVAIELDERAANSGRTAKVFYVALAPSGYTGLSQLVDNKVPIRLKVVPSVTGVEVASWAGYDDTYAIGEVISVRVTFSEAVEVTGTPTLVIDMDPAPGGRNVAVYAGGSGTDELVFHHAVVEPNYSSRGIAVLANTLYLNRGSIRAVTDGVDADLAQPGLGHDPAHKVDWQQQQVFVPVSGPSIQMLCTPAQPYDAANQRWTLVEPVRPAGEPYVPGALVAGHCSVSVPEDADAAYSLSGADADMFEISTEGELSFAAAPDYETPADSDKDNVYEVTVTATVGKKTTAADLAVAVTEAQEPEVITLGPPEPTDRSMVPTSAAVSGNELTLTFSRSLAAVDDTTAATLRQSFLIHGAQDSQGNPVHNQSPSQLTVHGATVTLTLGTPIPPGAEATIIYFGGLTDTDGNPVPNFATALVTTQRD